MFFYQELPARGYFRKRRPRPPSRPRTGGSPMTDYKYDFVKVRVRDGIAWTALNRPEKSNAMSPALHYEMDEALARLEVDDDVKVVVVTGEGGNFSAGQDLKKFFRELERDPAERKKAAAAPIAGDGSGSTATTSPR